MSESMDELEARVDAAFDALVESQRARLMRIARRQVPHLTEDDVKNPHDFAGLAGNAEFEYEDGYLAGLVAAQIAIRARVFRVEPPPRT